MYTCNHLTIRTTDLNQAKEFYATRLGLELLGGSEHTFAVKAGQIRLSFFREQEEGPASQRMDIILRTDDLEAAMRSLKESNVPILEDIIEAPGFMRFFTIEDPDKNIIHVAQYLRDPIAGY